MFWILLVKTVEELTRFSSVKQLVRFLKDKVGDKASRKIYKLLKHILWSEVLSWKSTRKKLWFPEAQLIEEVEEDGTILSCFCVVLFLFFES